MREPPPVTVHGQDAPGPVPRRRRWPLLLVPALLAGLLVLDQRGREPEALVELTALRGTSGPGVAEGRAEVRLRLRNDADRDVIVEAARLGEYELARPLPLRAGATGTLVLAQDVRCTASPPPPLIDVVLELRLATARGGRDAQVRLGDPVRPDGAARTCGFLPLEEAVTPQVVFARSAPTRVLLDVELQVGGVQPVVLTGARGGRVVSGGPGVGVPTPLALPLQLPAVEPAGPLLRTATIGLLLDACAGPVPEVVELLLDDGQRTAAVGVDVSAYADALSDPPC